MRKSNLCQQTKLDLYSSFEKMLKGAKQDCLTYVTVIAYGLKRRKKNITMYSLITFHCFDMSREIYNINFQG